MRSMPQLSISSPAFSFTSSCAMEALEAMTTELGVPGWLMVLPRCNSRVGSTWLCYRSFKAWQPKISVTKLVLLTNHPLFGGTQNTDNRRQSVSFCYSLQYTLPWRVEGHSPALQLASVASVLLPEKTGWKQMHTYYVVSRYVHILYIIHLSY